MQVMPLAILPIMIFGGLFVNLETIPAVFHWIQYISPIKYSYNAMLLEESGAHIVRPAIPARALLQRVSEGLESNCLLVSTGVGGERV